MARGAEIPNAGYSALKMGKPLFVALYDDMNGSREGSQRLIDEGAKPLLRNRATSQAPRSVRKRRLGQLSDAAKNQS